MRDYMSVWMSAVFGSWRHGAAVCLFHCFACALIMFRWYIVTFCLFVAAHAISVAFWREQSVLYQLCVWCMLCLCCFVFFLPPLTYTLLFTIFRIVHSVILERGLFPSVIVTQLTMFYFGGQRFVFVGYGFVWLGTGWFSWVWVSLCMGMGLFWSGFFFFSPDLSFVG